MRAGSGKSKGSAFEREVCKHISLWLSNGQKSDILWRSAMSGGRSTVALKHGLKLSSQAGDISLIDSQGQEFIDTFVVECKFYKKWTFRDLIYDNNVGLPVFWDQVNRDAKEHDKQPLLVAKQNFYKPIVCVKRKVINDLRHESKKYIGLYLKAYFPQYNMYVLLFEDFFSNKFMSPDDLSIINGTYK